MGFALLQEGSRPVHSALMGPWEPETGRKPELDEAARRPGREGPHGNGHTDRWGAGGRGTPLDHSNRGQRGWRDEERSSALPGRRDGPPGPRYAGTIEPFSC